MSESLDCLQMCTTCPLRDGSEATPDVVLETAWESHGQISEDRRSVSIEFSYGKPTSERVSTVVLGTRVNEDEVIAVSRRFRVLGSQLDSGQVAEAFSSCEKPVTNKEGLFRRKKIGCGALRSLQSS